MTVIIFIQHQSSSSSLSTYAFSTSNNGDVQTLKGQRSNRNCWTPPTISFLSYDGGRRRPQIHLLQLKESSNHEQQQESTVLPTPTQSIKTSSASATTVESQLPFFIREASTDDLNRASVILTDGFFSDTTNIFTYQVEKVKTFLSLESCYPLPKHQEIHKYLVACEREIEEDTTETATTTTSREVKWGRKKKNDNVIGFVEIDCRPKKEGKTMKVPYMCNLAVDLKWKRKGIASALVHECECLAKNCFAESIFLKVRSGNTGAIRMYEKLGYSIDSSEVKNENEKEILLLMMKKEL